MSRYAQGEDAAFAQVYDLVSPRLRAFLRRRCGEPDLADDLLQQTFLHAHRARSRFTDGAEVLPWLFAIARRLAIDAARHRGRSPFIRADAAMAAACSGAAAPDDEAFAAQLAERADGILARLPPAQREAFHLIKCDGLTFRQAACVLGTTIPAVKLRAQRAYDALRAGLGSRPAIGELLHGR
jgi:RNA polymerase sigma-70 factor (ECF subfamily)